MTGATPSKQGASQRPILLPSLSPLSSPSVRISPLKKTFTKNTILGFSLSTVESYNCNLFIFLLPIIAPLFFQGSTYNSSMMQAYKYLWFAYFFYPLGSLLFGPIGDRLGRRLTLALSSILLIFSTASIGFLPLFSSSGSSSPLFLLSILCTQSVASGGLYNGMAIFTVEHAPKNQKGRVSGLIFSFAVIGLLLAALSSLVCSLKIMPPYAWRIPFVLTLIWLVLGYCIFAVAEEPPAFSAAQRFEHIKKDFFLLAYYRVLKNNFWSVVKVVGIAGTFGAFYYTSTTLFISFVPMINPSIEVNSMMKILPILLIPYLLLLFISGLLAEKFGEKRIMLCGIIFVLISCIPVFFILDKGSLSLVLLGQLLLLIGTALFAGPSHAFINKLFPVQARYRCVTTGFTVGWFLISSITPYLVMKIWSSFKVSFMPSFWLVSCCILGALCLRTYGEP